MRIKNLAVLLLVLLPLSSFSQGKEDGVIPPPLKVGVSVNIKGITPEKMAYAKAVGISCVNISLNSLVSRPGNINMSDTAIKKLVGNVKIAVEKAGLSVAAFHMPFGQHKDFSVINDSARQTVIAVDEKLLKLCEPLKPKIVLFHPSWFLSLNQREEHIHQMVKSAIELNKAVKAMGSTMVLENMTGPQLYVTYHGKKYERPLFRTVKETLRIMNMLPSDICAAVDMNHIKHPEKLVLALGSRLKFIHVSDGDDVHENHYYPCSGKGINNWMAIIGALYKVGYTGPFMYECHYKNLRDLAPCYNFMYNKYILQKYIKPEYKKAKKDE